MQEEYGTLVFIQSWLTAFTKYAKVQSLISPVRNQPGIRHGFIVCFNSCLHGGMSIITSNRVSKRVTPADQKISVTNSLFRSIKMKPVERIVFKTA